MPAAGSAAAAAAGVSAGEVVACAAMGAGADEAAGAAFEAAGVPGLFEQLAAANPAHSSTGMVNTRRQEGMNSVLSWRRLKTWGTGRTAEALHQRRSVEVRGRRGG
jgi:hypothetical protein